MTPASRGPKAEIRKSKIENRNSEAEIRKSKFEIRSSAPGPSFDFRVSNFGFLLEVGCEEIPARFLRDAERGLGERVQAALSGARLLPEVGAVCEPPLRTYSTPRRLVVYVPALLGQQPDKVEEILGPPVRVAVDAGGKYTRAAESFAQKNSARLKDLVRTTTSKGEYLALRKTTQGRSALAMLPEILPEAILALSFPKSMYWRGKSAPRFVRPIRWVLAVLGEGKQATTVEFEILGVKSGDFTFGHRAKSHPRLRVTGFKDYARKLARQDVEIDPARRRERVLEEAKALVQKASLELVQDDWLVDWVVNSTEWPRPLLGSFDQRFLHLPREILTTVMRDHQKYFAVEHVGPSGARPSGQDQLAPHFVAVLNMDSDEKGLIRQGHERVLAARFSDAEFFWKTDLKTTLFERIPLLDGITYQAGLGTYAEKLSRMKTIASGLCERLEAYPVAFVPWHYGGSPRGLSKQPVKVRFTHEHTRNILRAVELCKCDLTTQMVQEFPELQGIVGGLYLGAQPSPESPEVAEAIYDHYRPASAEDTCPRSIVGAVVSLADKLDSVVAGFAVGHQPTSSGDPFALRRQGNGIIKVLLEFQMPICLDELAEEYHKRVSQERGLGIQASLAWDRVLVEVSEFFRERLSYHLESVRGLRFDTVRAVLAAAPERGGIASVSPLDALRRAEALEALRGREDLQALCAAAKRIRNILVKSATAVDWKPGEVEAALLQELPEKELFEVYSKVAGEAGRRREGYDYQGALEEISSLRPAVDRFFDGVLVMADDPEVRQNRLRLLKKLDELFSGIAHFAEIV
jgi:glycyl-tRNA synthetase beta chain